MNKEQSADDPSVDLIRVKNMLNSTISMSYPDVVIACIEHKVSLEAFRAIEAALVKHDNNMKDYSLVTTGDPAREFTMIQSAPLMLLADPDEFVSVQLA